jgi:hypothetical protein
MDVSLVEPVIIILLYLNILLYLLLHTLLCFRQCNYLFLFSNFIPFHNMWNK